MFIARTIGVAVVLLSFATQSPAFGASQVEAKIARSTANAIAVAGKLKALNKNGALKRALKNENSDILLARIEGQEFKRGRTIYARGYGFMGIMTASLPSKYLPTWELVMGPKGLKVNAFERSAPPTKATIDNYRADLDSQFARKSGVLKTPDVAIVHEPFGARSLRSSVKVKTGLLRPGKKLDPSWSAHLTPAIIDAAMESWGKR